MMKVRSVVQRAVSPIGLLGWAALIAAGHFATALAGWREATIVLSGTVPDGLSMEAASLQAMIYMTGYFGLVLVVPVLLFASGLSAVFLSIVGRKISPRSPSDSSN